MASDKFNFRVHISCKKFSEDFCSAFEDILTIKGLKALFFKNILLSIDNGDQDEIKKRFASVLMGKFKIVFEDDDSEGITVEHNEHKKAKQLGTMFDAFKDELSQISNQFAKSISAEDK